MQYRWLSAAETHAGRVRSLNEDACLNLPADGIWAVADGMGGHSAGDVASTLVVESLRDVASGSDLEQRVDDVVFRLKSCNGELYARAQESGAQIIGSTVAVLISQGSRAACIWAGDSRVYRLRDGVLSQLTEDHSRVQEMVSSGQLSADAARHHPQSNVVTRAVGAAADLEPGTITFAVRARDVFLLCSDGLTGELTDPEIQGFLVDGDCQHCADALIDASLLKGARDNVSVVVAQAHDDTPTEFGTRRDWGDEDGAEKTLLRR